jgi:hypothetical protein
MAGKQYLTPRLNAGIVDWDSVDVVKSNAKRHFANLLPQKEEIEAALGFALDWRELPDKTASRIVAWYSDASIEDESRWEEYQSWLIQCLVAMERVLRPRVRALP